ncbi:antigen 5 like allergen Cul n 1-like [Sabethes cyaneus]|uniref:antigen 5 like allergen Cul n 1-like n=1 Tax=Sabethes cyaneus TaxID=53552 RepID=UPI00237DB4F3|nr:antigen 5 like allergen Cul n 1-like [Sabethes cyaneus]
MLVSAIIVLVALLVESQATNYCDPDLCPQRGPHVGCHASRGFSPNCGNKYEAIEMTNGRKQQILHQHNKLRSNIAQGEYRGFPTASRMATLLWDDELAQLAAINARTCRFGHDRCRSTDKFQYAGQNIAWTAFMGYDFTPESRMENFTLSWFNEYKDCPTSAVKSYPRNYRGPMIGHFTQIVSDRSTRIGCAMMKYILRQQTNFYFVCNYSMTNIVNQPVYKSGKTASACKTGANHDYKGLCNPNEEISSDPAEE